jgi:hypothetical protein
MTGREMLREIWREIRDDVKSWNIQWRWLTAAELEDLHPRLNPATGLPLVNGSLLDGAGNPYGVDLSHYRDYHKESAAEPFKFVATLQAESASSNWTLSDLDRDSCGWSGPQSSRW